MWNIVTTSFSNQKLWCKKNITRWRLIKQKIARLRLSYCTKTKSTKLYLRALTLLELGKVPCAPPIGNSYFLLFANREHRLISSDLYFLPNSVPAQAWLSWLYFQLIQPPDTQTSINLASFNSKLKGKVVYIDIMNSKTSLNFNFINHRPNWPLSSIIWGISWFLLS